MRLDQVTAEIRPRSDWESVDLGLALVRRDFWRCLVLWWLAMGVPAGLGVWWLWDSPVWLMFWFWWLKLAGSRMVLFQLSRRLFGEMPGWRSLWREVPRVWVRRFWYRMVWARVSFWLPLSLPVEELEGLRGKVYAQRMAQVMRRGTGAVVWVWVLGILAALGMGFALFQLLDMMMPQGQESPWAAAAAQWDPESPLVFPVLYRRAFALSFMVALSLADIFATGAGFGLYVNTRTWIEGWDVELAFRRLALRLGKGVGLVILAGILWLPTARGAEHDAWRPPGAVETGAEPKDEARQPKDVMREVVADPDFEIRKIKRRVYSSKDGSDVAATGLPVVLGWIMTIVAVTAVLGFLVWLVWTYRYVFQGRKVGSMPKASPVAARVVMGMEVTPESLPQDIPGMAWDLWRQGRHQDALGLLYRGAISRVIEHGRVEIQEADTEGDCLQRVETVGAPAHPAYFRGLTGVWIRLAYAGRMPGDGEVESLCRGWPFAERRQA